MHNIQDLRNGASRLIYLTAVVQQSATRGQVAAESLHKWLETSHKDTLFSDEEIESIRAAYGLLSTTDERMKSLVMPDIQQKCQTL